MKPGRGGSGFPLKFISSVAKLMLVCPVCSTGTNGVPRVVLPSRKILPHFLQFLFPTCGGFTNMMDFDRVLVRRIENCHHETNHDEEEKSWWKKAASCAPSSCVGPPRRVAKGKMTHFRSTAAICCSRCHRQKIDKSHRKLRNALRLKLDEPKRHWGLEQCKEFPRSYTTW